MGNTSCVCGGDPRRGRRRPVVPEDRAAPSQQRRSNCSRHLDHRPARAGAGRRREAIRRSQPTGRAVPAPHDVRHRRGEDPRGTHLPRGDLDRRHHRAVGLDALHAGRPGDQCKRRERARRADARLVAQPPGLDHLGTGWRACRARRSPGGAVDGIVDHDVHDRRHHRRTRRSAARRIPLVPDDVRRRLDHRSQRVDGNAVQGQRRAMVPPEPDHRPAASAGLPGDPAGARCARTRPAVALARQ